MFFAMFPTGLLVLTIVLVVLGIVLLINALVKVSPHEKAVKERLSKYHSLLGQGWHFLIPFLDQVRKVDMRERVINTPPQDMITSDNAVVTVDAVIFTQVYDPVKAVYEIQDAFLAISNLSITTLRSIIGTMTLDQVLWDRQSINAKVQTELADETAKWWVQINKIEIQRIDPPRALMDAMNQQKIAQQEKRAAILEAEWAKESAIRAAEWVKEKQMLEAEGQANAIERIAEAKAKAIELESNAAMAYFKDAAVTKEQLRVIESALRENTKFVMETGVLDLLKKFKIG